MRHEEFESICHLVESGRDMNVKHIVTHQVGKIIACQAAEEFFEIEMPGGEHKMWSKENVREVK